MKPISIITKVLQYDKIEDIDKPDQELVLEARKACENAYAPYSRFKVGAAVRLDDGTIVLGSNIENAAFPSGICAERSALYAAASNYPLNKPVTIAIAAMKDKIFTSEPVTPCGNCRQVIAEETVRNGIQLKVILSGKSNIFIVEEGSDLLPLQFNGNILSSTLP